MPVLDTPLARDVLAKAPGLSGMYHRYTNDLDRLARLGYLKDADLVGKRVLDWECGAGVFSLLFLERGAASCEAIDSWLMPEECDKAMGHIPNLKFAKVSIEDYAADPARHASFDFIFANTVTEHMLNLPRQLPLIGRLLKPGGPCTTILRQGPACWESPDKCAASAEHRAKTQKNLWWTWDDAMERKLTPSDCTQCPYYKRSQPWAHLTCHNESREVFPQVGFTTGYAKSSLNKVTPFQLRQFVIEAGFDIAGWVTNKIKNEPPEALLQPPFNFAKEDLQTCTITVVARKAHSPYGE